MKMSLNVSDFGLKNVFVVVLLKYCYIVSS